MCSIHLPLPLPPRPGQLLGDLLVTASIAFLPSLLVLNHIPVSAGICRKSDHTRLRGVSGCFTASGLWWTIPRWGIEMASAVGGQWYQVTKIKNPVWGWDQCPLGWNMEMRRSWQTHFHFLPLLDELFYSFYRCFHMNCLGSSGYLGDVPPCICSPSFPTSPFPLILLLWDFPLPLRP